QGFVVAVGNGVSVIAVEVTVGLVTGVNEIVGTATKVSVREEANVDTACVRIKSTSVFSSV
ncbi:MAG: hypothetical protein HC797_05250, partial [Anaerolineales bacterium]|nr:hypothetical protein [Anaerolineales bacterium]